MSPSAFLSNQEGIASPTPDKQGHRPRSTTWTGAGYSLRGTDLAKRMKRGTNSAVPVIDMGRVEETQLRDG